MGDIKKKDGHQVMIPLFGIQYFMEDMGGGKHVMTFPCDYKSDVESLKQEIAKFNLPYEVNEVDGKYDVTFYYQETGHEDLICG